MHDEKMNYLLAVGVGSLQYLLLGDAAVSICLSIFLFLAGKAIDLFVKPYLEERRRKKGRGTRDEGRGAE